VYQRPDSINVGCSPPAFPTAQYIACNRRKFIISEAQEGMLVKDECESGVTGAAGRRSNLHPALLGTAALLASVLLAL
jgi:hypothetical protein